MNNKNECTDRDAGQISASNGTEYFFFGKSKIKISEHFKENGKPISALLENVICHAADKAS